ncbi:MAG: S8 family peptidase [Atopobiaceae bacterium]|nr:S8 family peptidase [Atopobiaceae bacterium]
MNDLLLLSGGFETRPAAGGGAPTLPPRAVIKPEDLYALANQLDSVLDNWRGSTFLKDVLITVEYRQVVAKSNRVVTLLKSPNHPSEESIVGARYADIGTPDERHVMTHYVSAQAIRDSARLLRDVADILSTNFDSLATRELLESLCDKDMDRERWKRLTGGKMPKSTFAQTIRDAHYVRSFSPSQLPKGTRETQIVTLYETEWETEQLLQRLGIDILSYNVLGSSVLMNAAQYSMLLERAPYLVAMACDDISQIDTLDLNHTSWDTGEASILPPPSNEPWVGVIDTPYDTVNLPYFSEWVDAVPMLPVDINLSESDYEHGTLVTSLIVDGNGINPQLEDGCGHFRVKHFGVAAGTEYSSFEVVKKIERIVSENCGEIRVWNLSLGSREPVADNSVSPEAAELDRIQKQYGVLFVVAGTNDKEHGGKRIGTPADSVNALVVNAVRENGEPASYTRHGPVVGFHRKPDVSYYGGDEIEGEFVWAHCGSGPLPVSGTSFAAPLVTRKVAYLVYKMGLSCEVAKALIIDSACGWDIPIDQNWRGYGVVPIHIKDVLQSNNDEIKLAISGEATEYEMYNYRLPVPVSKGMHPYVARATLCYFPECNRNQGVDYTSTELDLHFGRIRGTNIKSLKGNTQGEQGDLTTEIDARKKQRKWDNVKHVSDVLTDATRPRKAYENPLWAIKLRKTSRYRRGSRQPQRFGLVVTLKELNGVNRFETFAQQCSALGWIVNRVELETRVSIYESSQVDIEFE